jgi:hypothetical protein
MAGRQIPEIIAKSVAKRKLVKFVYTPEGKEAHRLAFSRQKQSSIREIWSNAPSLWL